MSEDTNAMRASTDAEQEPPVTTPPDPETVPGGPAAPDDRDSRDGGEDIKDDEHRSTAYQNAEAKS